MNKRQLRIGVVGVGARAPLALHAEAPENDAIIVAVADPSPHAENRVADRLGRAIPVTPSIDGWSNSVIDAAFVLSPDDSHETITCDLLERGIAVYVEKPLAITVAGATRILATAYRTKTPLYVATTCGICRW